jgi:nitrate reductase molybdenum cofactor assembly chaperone NarJ/NarW
VTDEKRVLLKAIGCLLDYPDEHFGELLDAVKKALSDLPPSTARDRLLEGIGNVAGMDPIVLQEEYTRLFDFSPGTTLELTYHKWGDAKERGAALAGLQRTYDDAGWTPVSGELPDFLPRVLEFLSVAPDEVGCRVLGDFRQELSGLADHVAAASKTYGPILEVLPWVALD